MQRYLNTWSRKEELKAKVPEEDKHVVPQRLDACLSYVVTSTHLIWLQTNGVLLCDMSLFCLNGRNEVAVPVLIMDAALHPAPSYLSAAQYPTFH